MRVFTSVYPVSPYICGRREGQGPASAPCLTACGASG